MPTRSSRRRGPLIKWQCFAHFVFFLLRSKFSVKMYATGAGMLAHAYTSWKHLEIVNMFLKLCSKLGSDPSDAAGSLVVVDAPCQQQLLDGVAQSVPYPGTTLPPLQWFVYAVL